MPAGSIVSIQQSINPGKIYFLKVNSRHYRKKCLICSKLKIKKSEKRQWRRPFGVFIINFQYISHPFYCFYYWSWRGKYLSGISSLLLQVSFLLMNSIKISCLYFLVYVMLCAIWYHFYNLKNEKNIHGETLLLVNLQTLACNFTKISTSPWVFFMFFNLYKYKTCTCKASLSLDKFAATISSL